MVALVQATSCVSSKSGLTCRRKLRFLEVNIGYTNVISDKMAVPFPLLNL